MAATIKIKNSSTAGAAPTSSDLVQGELAVNVTDKRLFTENASGTVVELGTNPSTLTVTAGATIQGLTVGKGAGAVASNTAVGASALNANTTGSNNVSFGQNALLSNTSGSYNTGLGRNALYSMTTGSNNSAVGFNALSGTTTGNYNTAVGQEALNANTTASNNTAVGYQAGYSNTTGTRNALLGYVAGYSLTGNYCTLIGAGAGYSTTGERNTFVGDYAGNLVTSGTKNTIIGKYDGNQGGLDIRTASNYIVLSDGDGNPRMICNNNGVFSNGAYGDGGSAYVWNVKTTGASGGFNWYLGATQLMWAYSGSSVAGGTNNADSILFLAKSSSTSRSLNAAGTLNASGADYAEYMTKAGNFTVAKGDVVGINPEGKLTNVFADAVSFVVKSTDPSYVGGDTWFTEQVPKDEANNPKQAGDAEYDAWVERLEAARTTVDRIAFAGQVPVNVTGATAGQYIIPVNDNGAIKGEAVSNPTFEQYQQAVGKVIAIEQDGRARIIVKVA